MTEESMVQLLSHPFVPGLLTVIVAAITAAVTVKLLGSRRAATRGIRAGGGVPHSDASEQAVDERAVVAAIAAAVTATVGAHRIIYIGARQSGSGWAAQLRSRHHASHMPQQPNRN